MRAVKAKRRDWMVRMYREGADRAEAMTNPETAARLRDVVSRLEGRAAGGKGKGGGGGLGGLGGDDGLDDLDLDALDPIAEQLLSWTEVSLPIPFPPRVCVGRPAGRWAALGAVAGTALARA